MNKLIKTFTTKDGVLNTITAEYDPVDGFRTGMLLQELDNLSEIVNKDKCQKAIPRFEEKLMKMINNEIEKINI
jgi:hypothetical protein